MKFPNILTALWGEPWLITTEAHRAISRIVEAHVDGSAHDAGGIIEAFHMPEDQDQDRDNKGFKIRDGVAIIPLHGVVGKRLGSLEKMSGAADVDDLVRMFGAALDDDSVEAILLHVDSPGGSTTGTPEAAEVVRAAAAIKPVVAFTDTQMASAAYWISAGATAIYASVSSSVGSIGVYMAWLDTSRAMEMQGVRTELIKEGKFKAAGIEGVPLTAEQRKMFQAQVAQVAGWFKSFVVAARPSVKPAAMEGQSFFADDALTAGLIDAVGDAEDAFNEARAMAAAVQSA